MLKPSVFKLNPGSMFPWEYSAFSNPRSGKLALTMQTVISDETIMTVLAEYIIDIKMINRAANFMCNSPAYGKYLDKLPNTILDSDFENQSRVVTTFARIVRNVINDIIFVSLVCKTPKVVNIDALSVTDQKPQKCHDDIVAMYVRVGKSIRKTMEYLATMNWVEISADGEVIYTEPEVKTMVQGIFRMFVLHMLTGPGIISKTLLAAVANPNPATPHRKYDPEALGFTSNIVIEAIVGIYGNNVPENATPNSPIVVSAATIISMLTGSVADEKNIRQLVSKIVQIMGARVKVAKGIQKTLLDSEHGKRTKRLKTVNQVRNLRSTDMARLGHIPTRNSVLKDFTDGALTNAVKQSKQNAGRGIVYALVDVSGSTLGTDPLSGAPSLSMVFESIALSIVQSARISQVDALICFYGQDVVFTQRFLVKDDNQAFRQNSYNLIGHANGYENAEGRAFNYLLQVMDMDYKMKPQPQTLFFLTDGKILTNNDMTAEQLRDRIELAENTRNLKVLPMVVNSSVDIRFHTAFRNSQFIHIKRGEDFSAAHVEDIMRFVAQLPISELQENPYNTLQDH